MIELKTENHSCKNDRLGHPRVDIIIKSTSNWPVSSNWPRQHGLENKLTTIIKFEETQTRLWLATNDKETMHCSKKLNYLDYPRDGKFQRQREIYRFGLDKNKDLP